MTQIGKSNVKWSEIRDVLNKNGGSVSNKAEDAFKVSSKYQKWARWKPTKYNIDFHPSARFNKDEMWHAAEDHYFGIKAPKIYSSDDIDTEIENYDDLWVINPPVGKIEVTNNEFNPSEPFRLGDFAGHDIESRHPIKYTSGADKIKYVEGAEYDMVFHCVFNNNNYTDWLDITDFGRGVDGDILGDNFSSYYFGGIFINMDNGFISVVTRNNTVDNTSVDSTDNKPSLYDATHSISVDYETFKNNGMIQTGKYKLYFAMFPNTVSAKESFSVADGFYIMPCKPLEFELYTGTESVSAVISSVKKLSNGYDVTLSITNGLSYDLELINSGLNYFNVGGKKYQYDGLYYISENYPSSTITIPSGETQSVTGWLSYIAGYDSNNQPEVGVEVEISFTLSIDGVIEGGGALVKIS